MENEYKSRFIILFFNEEDKDKEDAIPIRGITKLIEQDKKDETKLIEQDKKDETEEEKKETYNLSDFPSTIKLEGNNEYIVDDIDRRIIQSYIKTKKKHNICFLAEKSKDEKTENKIKQLIEKFFDQMESKVNGEVFIESILYLLLLKFPTLDKAFDHSAKFFAKKLNVDNLLIFNDIMNEFNPEYLERLPLEIIAQNDIKEQLKGANTDKSNPNNFYKMMRYFICSIANEHFEIKKKREFLNQNDNLERLIFEVFDDVIQSGKSKQFYDITCWKGKEKDDNNNFEDDYKHFYLFYKRYEKQFFKNLYKQKDPRFYRFENMKNTFNENWKLKNLNIIDEDDFYGTISINEINSLNDVENFKSLYLLIPLVRILEFFYPKGKGEFTKIAEKYFNIIKNIKNENIIFYIEQKDDIHLIEKDFLNEKCKTLETENEIFNNLKFNLSENEKGLHFIIEKKFTRKISFIYPYNRINVNALNCFMLKIFKLNERKDSININFFNNDFYKILIDLIQNKKDTSSDNFLSKKFYEYIYSLMNADIFELQNDQNFDKNCENKDIKDIIQNYLDKNLKEIIVDTLYNEENNKKCEIYFKENLNLNEFDKKLIIIIIKLCQHLINIYRFLNDNYIIKLFNDEFSDCFDNEEEFKLAMKSDFINDKIKIILNDESNLDKDQLNESEIYFFNMLFNSLNEVLNDSIIKYKNNLEQNELCDSIISNHQINVNQENRVKDFIDYLNDQAEKSIPSFINHITNINIYIEKIILKRINSFDYGKNEIIYKIIQLIEEINDPNKENPYSIIKGLTSNKNAIKFIYINVYFDCNKKYIFLLEKISEYIGIKKSFNDEFIEYDTDDGRRSEQKRLLIEPIDRALESLLQKFDSEKEPTKFYLENLHFLNFIIGSADAISCLSKGISSFSKELRRLESIQTFLKYVNISNLKENELSAKFEIYDGIIKSINYNLMDNKFDNDNLKDEYDTLQEKIKGNMKHFNIFINKFFSIKFKRYYEKDSTKPLRQEMIKIIINDYDLIKESYEFFNLVFTNYFDLPKNICSNNLEESSSQFLEDLDEKAMTKDVFADTFFGVYDDSILNFIEKILESKDNDELKQKYFYENDNVNINRKLEAFEEILINIFENKFLICFGNETIKNNFVNDIVTSYIYVAMKYLEKYNDNNNNELKCIKKLYYISFLKVFFNAYLNIVFNEKCNMDFSWVNERIKGDEDEDSESKPLKRDEKWLIKTYILKQLRSKFTCFNDLETFSFINHQMIWVSKFKFRESTPSLYDFIFSSSMENSYDDKEHPENTFLELYGKTESTLNALYKETFRTGKYDQDIKCILNTKNFDCFIDNIFNNYISRCYEEEHLTGLTYNEFSMWIENLLKGSDLFNELAEYTDIEGIKNYFVVLFTQEYFKKYILNFETTENNSEKPRINDLKSLEIILICMKLVLPFVIKKYNNINENELENISSIIGLADNLIKQMIVIDMGKYNENNTVGINNYYYQIDQKNSSHYNKEDNKEDQKNSDHIDNEDNNKLLNEKWKLILKDDKDHFYADNNIKFSEEYAANELQKKDNNLKPFTIQFNTLSKMSKIYLPHLSYEILYNQCYPITYEELISETVNKTLSFILYSMHFYFRIDSLIRNKEFNPNILTKEINKQFLIKIYHDLVKNLHLISIDNEKIFFNVLYQELKNKLEVKVVGDKDKKDFYKNVRDIIAGIINNYQINKDKYLDYIRNIIPYEQLSMRNILEDQKMKYDDIKSYDETTPFLPYFYHSEFPTLEYFTKAFNNIYQGKFKYPLIQFILDNLVDNEGSLGTEMINNLIDYLMIYGNDHTKIDIKYLKNYNKDNRFAKEDNNVVIDNDFIMECIRNNSYRNIYGKDHINRCNGDIINFNFDNIEKEIENLLIGTCYK